MVQNFNKDIFLKKFISLGEDKFYKYLIVYGIKKMSSAEENKEEMFEPAYELMEYSEAFLTFYRRDKKDIYIELSKLFRKAAHKLYRVAVKKGFKDNNKKFLHII